MLRYKWIDTLVMYTTSANFKYKTPAVSNSNAEWILFQIGRGIQKSKFIASVIKRNYMMEWILSDTLKDTGQSNKPTYLEADLFEKIMGAFIKFLENNEREYSALTLANIIKDVKIKVEDTEVMVFISNGEKSSLCKQLLSYFKNSIKNEKYTFRTISTESEANSWWNKSW